MVYGDDKIDMTPAKVIKLKKRGSMDVIGFHLAAITINLGRIADNLDYLVDVLKKEQERDDG